MGTEKLPVPARAADGPTVSLALGAGGARGLAHIGVIDEVVARGYRIRSIAGSSMGALVGGMYAAGKLDVYRDWAVAMERFDVLRLIDWTFSGGGFIKGERVINALRGLVGDVNIEELPISFTAVATDLDRQNEVWLARGSLFDAIRASIAIPSLVTPYVLEGRTLVDGGLLSPLPIAPTLRDLTDVTIAVNCNGPVESMPAAAPPPDEAPDGYAGRVRDFIEGIMGKGEPKPPSPGWRDFLAASIDCMQIALTRFELATHRPDLMINIPSNCCMFYEFYRAAELIQIGRDRASKALENFDPRRPSPFLRT